MQFLRVNARDYDSTTAPVSRVWGMVVVQRIFFAQKRNLFF